MSGSTEDIAFDRLGAIDTLANRLERERQDLALRAVMVDVVKDARRSAPHDRPGMLPETSTRAPGPAGNGWREPAPLETPGGAYAQQLIERMTPAHKAKAEKEEG